MNPTPLCAVFLALSFAATAGSAADQGGGSGWRPLLGEHSAPEWRGWKAQGLPAGWHVDGGVLHKDGPVDDLVSKRKYANFELELEWKIGKEGNSGIFYRGTREYDHIYWSAPEYQLLDDADTEDGKSPLTAAGSAYALYGVPPGVAKPYDQWNKTRLIVNGHHVEHWLNGVKVVEYDLASEDWRKRVAASKFSRYPHYGLAESGLIGIQGDHPGALAVRNIRIRVLP
ncbi:MAG TPA: DUF1080 domain-containing protein [Steroidobacteraceae bacterium]|nr:DUF1080 domain-containing protein [Steroidobacteraceae bacterium]